MMMKSFIFDLIGLAGFGCFLAGLYLMCGLDWAMIIGGLSAVVYSIAKQWGN